MLFQQRNVSKIPGYGSRMDDQDNSQQLNPHQYHIPGYAGYVPGIRSENLFGKTYGKITHMSVTQKLHKGSDLPSEQRYKSMFQGEFTDTKDAQKDPVQQFPKSSYLKPQHQQQQEKETDQIQFKQLPEQKCTLSYEQAYQLAHQK